MPLVVEVHPVHDVMLIRADPGVSDVNNAIVFLSIVVPNGAQVSGGARGVGTECESEFATVY